MVLLSGQVVSDVSRHPPAPSASQARPKKRARENGPKRAPYVAAACDFCHGRKLKCSGDRPCSRCQKHHVSCSYPVEDMPDRHQPASETTLVSLDVQSDSSTLFATIDDLQWQLKDLKSKLSHTSIPQPAAVPASTNTVPSDVVRNRTRDKQGSTPQSQSRALDVYGDARSFAYSMNTADARLSSIGEPTVSVDTPGDLIKADESENLLSSPLDPQIPVANQGHNAKDLETFSVDTVTQLLDTFQSIFGVLHPLAQMESLKLNASILLRALKRSLWTQPTRPGECGLLEILKITLAISLIAQSGGQTDLARALYKSVEPVASGAAFCTTISYDFRTFLLLLAIYQFENGDLVLGCRTIMFAARTAVEQGLYRREKVVNSIPNQQQRESTIRLLWSLFVLDRQFNFAAGLPQHLNDSDVDLPLPIDAPYLTAMSHYVILGAHAWNTIVNRDTLALGKGPSGQAVTYFRYQLDQWHRDMDHSVRFDTALIESDDAFFVSPDNEASLYIKALLYLRCNQIQILILRPILIYHQAAQNSPELIVEAVDIAKRSIRVLQRMSENVDLYKTRQVILHHFLSSALALLFLAVAYDAENQKVKNPGPVLMTDSSEMQMGLDLIDQHRASSESADRLWSCFAPPRQHLIRLGILQDRHRQSEGMRSSSATATDVSGHQDVSDDLADFDPQFDYGQLDMEPINSLQWLDWGDTVFTESSDSFGMPSWM
ncbi:hypothetical protein EDD36DRAFT_331376 [Exophiala viscosa]|uniref:Zn(2)-C6 fungal-type domain-containing protein n=1 Tax=Exophiala viscosa TaxID=2486360 RepID=A0AAN6DSH6_9EURO|nr:hypothetical protein EDD36DRAFT_331376 [Exophiala viscosa]